MTLREKIARAIWAKRPDGGLMGRPFPFVDNDLARRTYCTASLDDGKVAACDLCFDYADAALKVITAEYRP
jgi:hypothetical protein